MRNVGMVLARQLAIGSFDLVPRRIASDAEDELVTSSPAQLAALAGRIGARSGGRSDPDDRERDVEPEPGEGEIDLGGRW